MRKTPLENMIKEKIGVPAGNALTREDISLYQLQKLRETIDYAKKHSSFYQQYLAGLSGGTLNDLEDMNRFPYTTAEDLRKNSLSFLCVSHSDVARVVTLSSQVEDLPAKVNLLNSTPIFTLNSSGTTAEPKRLYFTEEDLELTIDFFHHGMSLIVEPGQRVLILLPGGRPGSVGDLLVKGLKRMGVDGRVHGPVLNASETIKEIVNFKADCLVGIPAQLLALVRHRDVEIIPPSTIKSVLLSTDYVSVAVVKEIEKFWGCPVFNHYGMTETGLGGGVECRALSGYHLREADLFFEIIDPKTGRLQPDGEEGEIVFTTLTRKGMPLIRYRTGDLARVLPEPCPCGTVLKRMEKVRGRLSGILNLSCGYSLSITDLDEAILPVAGIINYHAGVSGRKGKETLEIVLHISPGAEQDVLPAVVRSALTELNTVREIFGESGLVISSVITGQSAHPSTGTAKRMISDNRETD